MPTDAAIVGIGETVVGLQPGRTAVDLQADAIVRAVTDAGFGVTDVDGLFVLGPYSRPSIMFGLTIAQHLGLRPSVEATIDAGGTVSFLHMLSFATAAIQRGDCQVAVCVFGENAASGRQDGDHGWASSDRVEFEEPFGIVGTVVPYALLASAYMATYGGGPEDLGAIAIATRRHAMRNPNALRRKELDLDSYLGSRMIATPLRLLDCSSIVDGAGAIVLCASERAADRPHPAVRVAGVACRATHRDVGQMPFPPDFGIGDLAASALRAGDMSIEDADVAMIHDAFTISTAIYLEELGFCQRGEAGDYARAGNLDLGSRCPVNTHGGLLSQGHVGGILHVVEAVRQLRGAAGERQVAGAARAVVAGGGAIMGVNGVAVLERTG